LQGNVMSAKSVAVVTSASKGLGRATARRQSFFERGHLRTISPWRATSRAGISRFGKPEEVCRSDCAISSAPQRSG
jgi:hypothetical protein